MSPLCAAHTELHTELQTSSFHFTLPLTALSIPMTKEGYLRMKHRLFQTCCNYNLLLDKVKEVDFCEQQVETACNGIVQSVVETQEQWKKRFSGVKENCLRKMHNALEEIRLHALEQGWNPLESSLSHLLWCTETERVAGSSIFEFRAECNRAEFSRLLEVQLQFITSDLGQLGISRDGPTFTLRDCSHSSLVEDLKLKLEAANKETEQLRIWATKIYDKAAGEDRVIETLRAESDRIQQICSRVKEEKDILQEQCNAQLEQLKDMQDLLDSSRERVLDLENRCEALWLSAQREEAASDIDVKPEEHDSEAEYRSMQIDYSEDNSPPITSRLRSSGSAEMGEESVNDSLDDQHDDECYVCGGELILCDSCQHVAHLQCVNLFVCFRQALPEEDWFCDDCKRQLIRPAHPVTRRYRRLRKRNFNSSGASRRA